MKHKILNESKELQKGGKKKETQIGNVGKEYFGWAYTTTSIITFNISRLHSWIKRESSSRWLNEQGSGLLLVRDVLYV